MQTGSTHLSLSYNKTLNPHNQQSKLCLILHPNRPLPLENKIPLNRKLLSRRLTRMNWINGITRLLIVLKRLLRNLIRNEYHQIKVMREMYQLQSLSKMMMTKILMNKETLKVIRLSYDQILHSNMRMVIFTEDKVCHHKLDRVLEYQLMEMRMKFMLVFGKIINTMVREDSTISMQSNFMSLSNGQI